MPVGTLVAAPSDGDRAALRLWALEEAVPSLLARQPDIRRATGEWGRRTAFPDTRGHARALILLQGRAPGDRPGHRPFPA
ncbi:hypothetical protein CHELA40_11871 [Chelatococcus asaccharovorans]|nr:hypothetical protein CHELA40_11871 [Chelatococcus asaccharovorans]CAH1683895.1 hypothetical protein CHELA17_63728 [Chelatococcus asaccharovorans]